MSTVVSPSRARQNEVASLNKSTTFCFSSDSLLAAARCARMLELIIAKKRVEHAARTDPVGSSSGDFRMLAGMLDLPFFPALPSVAL